MFRSAFTSTDFFLHKTSSRIAHWSAKRLSNIFSAMLYSFVLTVIGIHFILLSNLLTEVISDRDMIMQGS
jgi:hypothetical protein